MRQVYTLLWTRIDCAVVVHFHLHKTTDHACRRITQTKVTNGLHNAIKCNAIKLKYPHYLYPFWGGKEEASHPQQNSFLGVSFFLWAERSNFGPLLMLWHKVHPLESLLAILWTLSSTECRCSLSTFFVFLLVSQWSILPRKGRNRHVFDPHDTTPVFFLLYSVIYPKQVTIRVDLIKFTLSCTSSFWT